MDVNYEVLLQQSNQFRNFIKSDIASLSHDLLTWKENEKKWSILEVVSHLNQIYNRYFENFNKAIDHAPDLNGLAQKKQSTIMGKLSIYAMKPKKKKRRFKMKTFDFFEPVIDPKKTDDTLNLFIDNKERFNEIIRKARLKDLRGIKMPTALGEKMKFYVPECLEFVLAHEARHIVQIQEVLEKAKPNVSPTP